VNSTAVSTSCSETDHPDRRRRSAGVQVDAEADVGFFVRAAARWVPAGRLARHRSTHDDDDDDRQRRTNKRRTERAARVAPLNPSRRERARRAGVPDSLNRQLRRPTPPRSFDRLRSQC